MNPCDNLRVSKIIITVGSAGARKDFVCGWLGLCNGSVRTPWIIDPLVGYSRINTAQWSVTLLLDSIDCGDLIIDPTVNCTLAISCHIDNDVSTSDSNINRLANLVDSGILTIAGIDLSRADMIQYHWDRLVKVHLCVGMEYNNHFRQHKIRFVGNLFDTSEFVTNNYAIDYINNKIDIAITDQQLPDNNQLNYLMFYKKLAPLLPIDLDYAELFKPGGSHYLCKMLGTTAQKRAHDYWNAMLPFINAPESVDAFGTHWHRSMIVN